MEWYLQAMRSWNNFEGRARRTEYWMYVLFYCLMCFVSAILSTIIGSLGSIMFGIVIVIHIIPGLAVAVRRLHDSGNSGWWLLISLVPLVGTIVLLVFYCQDSVPGNKWGPNPKNVSSYGDLEGVLDDMT